MKDKSKRIALAGIGSAISLLFVVAGYYLDMISLTMNVFATAGLMLTLYKGYYREAVLSFIVVSGLVFLIVNIGAVPFIMVGGSYTIFTLFWENKGYNYYKSLPIKIAYSALVFFILYQVINYIAIDFERFSILKNLNKGLLYFLMNLAFSILFVVYDSLLLLCYRYLKNKVFNKIIK